MYICTYISIRCQPGVGGAAIISTDAVFRFSKTTDSNKGQRMGGVNAQMSLFDRGNWATMPGLKLFVRISRIGRGRHTVMHRGRFLMQWQANTIYIDTYVDRYCS